tara:strand:- start:27 stop:857 length:831 start_codon:yes stop_codon:yes gene_type:complete
MPPTLQIPVVSYSSLPKQCAVCSHEYLKPHSKKCPKCGSNAGAIIFPKDTYMEGVGMVHGRNYKAGEIYFHKAQNREMRWDGIYWRCIEHDRIAGKCRDCGVGYCEHGKRAYRCKECGTGYCEHGRREQRCPECKGRQTCKHEKMRNTCSICDPAGYLGNRIRRRIGTALRSKYLAKASKSELLLGCTFQEARDYIENQFLDGMNWANSENWHIDHRRPIASFDLENEEELKMCFHYTNLQPMWAEDNLAKGAKFDEKRFDWEWDGSMWTKKVESR